jgi:hypothetical protein
MSLEFIDISKNFYIPECKDPEHNAPTHIVVPAGKLCVHTCPACKSVTYVQNAATFLKG